jgi:hypothetical protein
LERGATGISLALIPFGPKDHSEGGVPVHHDLLAVLKSANSITRRTWLIEEAGQRLVPSVDFPRISLVEAALIAKTLGGNSGIRKEA